MEMVPQPVTGWEEIDSQHADLIGRAAELKARVEARDAAGACAVLEGFLEATLRHFATEEELMERSQYPERTAHKGAHDLFVCDLYALSVIEDDKAWYIEHRYLSTERAKAVTRGINDRCWALRPHAKTLVDGFGIPEPLRYAEMLHPENLSD